MARIIKPSKASIVKLDKLFAKLKKWEETEQDQLERTDSIVGSTCKWEFAHSMRAFEEILDSMHAARGDD